MNNTTYSKSKEFWRGFRMGVPICLGYLAVSFGVGIAAVNSGMEAWVAVVMSLTNLTSAGEVAGIGVIAAAGPYIEMVLTQLLINCRYSLMGLSLAQNLAPDFRRGHRMLAAYGITDEIFGVAAAEKSPVHPHFMYGLITVSAAGWTLGTFLGAVSGDILPAVLSSALGILIYGMFIAIIIPPVRGSLNNLLDIVIAAAVSCIIYYLLPGITSGFSIIISAVIAAGIMAFAAPVSKQTDESGEEVNGK